VREAPFRRSFSYRIAMIDIDIDRLDEAASLSPLFSVNRANVISFRSEDHGDRAQGASLRIWADARFSEADIDLEGGAVRLVTFPRMLGVGFAPISIWYGYDAANRLRGVIYEVHNTFGETHAYVCALDETELRQTAEKQFFVSPFFDVSGDYRFTLRQPSSKMELIVENIQPGGRTHIASLLARPRPLTSGAILRWLVQMPFSGLGVVLAIHWQAIGLFLKRAQYHIKPMQRDERTTLARAASAMVGADTSSRVEKARKRA
jgi:uncharacterized protein